MTLEEMIRAVQQVLGVQVDGRAGPQTWGAIHQALVGPTGTAAPAETASASTPALAPVDARSERVIATLLPALQPLARALIQQADGVGIRIRVISGLRTYAEQEALYAQGRTAPGPIVTRARAGHSTHNFGIAFDIGVFEGSRYLTESPKYKAVGALGLELGLEWGGNWKSFVDEPHFQLRPAWAGAMTERQLLAALRERTATGQSLYA